MPKLPETYQFVKPKVVPVQISYPNTATIKTSPISSSNKINVAIDSTRQAIEEVRRVIEGVGREQRNDVDQENRMLRELCDRMITMQDDLSRFLTEIAAVVNGLAVVDRVLGSQFLQGVSYFGIAAAEQNIIQTDLSTLAFDGFNLVRYWGRWDKAGEAGSALTSGGEKNGEAWDRFRFAVLMANQLQMRVDITLSSQLFDGIDAHKRGMETVLTELADVKYWILDIDNEHNGATSAAEVAELSKRAKEIDPDRLVFASVSGTPTECAEVYAEDLDAGAQYDLVAPHFPREEGAPEAAEENANTFQETLADMGHGRPLYIQEDFRRGSPEGSDWSAEDFFTAFQGYFRAGARAINFHTAAGFNPAEGSIFEQFDDVENEVERGFHDALAKA